MAETMTSRQRLLAADLPGLVRLFSSEEMGKAITPYGLARCQQSSGLPADGSLLFHQGKQGFGMLLMSTCFARYVEEEATRV